METHSARLASFEAVHPTTKKRTSHAKGAKPIRWPHVTPSAAQLSKAGFYFTPTAASPDNATCFLCQKGLDGWEPKDNPIQEHLNYSPDCGWAVNIGLEQALEDGSLEEEDPMSVKMVEARKSTFAGMWPHEGKRGWTCKTQKMVDAGWYYCPTTESDDFVKCPYCQLSLDGWEPKDKPLEEHQRRSPDCLFFTLGQSMKSKTTRGKKGRPSKPSRMSMQSVVTTLSEDHSIADLGATEDDSVMTTATNMTSTSTALKTGKKGTKARAGKGKAASKSVKTKAHKLPETESVIEPEDDDFEVKIEVTPVKTTRGKKRTSDEMEDGNATTVQVVIPPAKRRATRTRSSTVKPQPIPEPEVDSVEDPVDDTHMTDAEEMPPPPLPISKKRGGKRASSTTRKASAMSMASKASLRSTIATDDDIDAALKVDLERPLTDEEDNVQLEEIQTSKPSTSRLTRTKPAQKKAKASVASVRTEVVSDVDNEEHVEIDQPENDQVDATTDTEAMQITNELPDCDPRLPPKTKKGKKGVKTRKTSPPNAMLEDRDAETLDATILDHEEAFAEVHPISEVAEPSMPTPTAVPAKKRIAARPDSKAPRSRQVSRQVPEPRQRTPVDSPEQVVVELSTKSEDLVNAHRSAEDDSGHETDASTLKDDAAKRRGKKPGPVSKKGKGLKKGTSKIQVDNNSATTPTPEIESNVEDPNSVGAQDTRQTSVTPPEPLGDGSRMDLDECLEPSESSAKGTEPAKPKATRGRPKAKAVLPTPVTSQEHSEFANSSFVDEQIAKVPSPCQEAVSPIPKTVSPTSTPQRPTSKDGVLSPTPSPQSSDAENHPPSTRPARQRPPLSIISPLGAQSTRVPLAARTPTTSPSKRNAASRLQTTCPWTSVDLENIFLGSPKAEKENGKPVPGKESLDEMMDMLTSPEKKMTVQEWVMHNAKNGEEKLRNECERLVGRFEGEGVRALKTLEGIVCVGED